MPMSVQNHNQATDLKMKASDFTVPIEERYFEDYLPGLILEYGTITLSETEIIDFATRFDPQYFHTDPETAKPKPRVRDDHDGNEYLSLQEVTGRNGD